MVSLNAKKYTLIIYMVPLMYSVSLHYQHLSIARALLINAEIARKHNEMLTVKKKITATK